MFSVPQRLLELAAVQCHMQQEGFYLLEKKINEAVIERHSYISQPGISFVKSGAQRIVDQDGNFLNVPAGKAIFLNRGLYTLSDFIPENGAFHNFILFFPLSFLQSFVSQYSKGPSVDGAETYLFDSGIEYEELIQNLIRLQERRTAGHVPLPLLEIKAHELFFLIQDACKDEDFRSFVGTAARQPKRNLRGFMEKHFDKSLRVEDFATLTGRSKSTFNRDFQRIFQTSPNKWLKEKRLERAGELLRRTSFQVNEVAQESGFANPSYFIAEFRKVYGQTPLEYRDRQA